MSEVEALNAILNVTEMVQERNHTSMAAFFDDLFSVYSANFSDNSRPLSVESSYSGLHLNTNYESSDFHKLVEEFRNGNVIHAKYALQILEDSTKLFENYPNVRECDMSTHSMNCVVVGDLHGSFKDLYYLIQKYGIPGKTHYFVFNGDFVDRGPQQIEILLTLLYANLLYPNRVFLNRGNHEDLSINLSKHFDPNFKQDCDKKYRKYSMSVFNQAQKVFQNLPVATIVKNKVDLRVFVVHGGLSDRLDLSYVKSRDFKRYKFASISTSKDQDSQTRHAAENFSDMLWSDPITSKSRTKSLNGCYPNKQRGCGYLFGADVSEKFCHDNHFDLVIRSHEVRDEGYTQDHPHCVTVFSSSLYCGGSNKAAVVLIDVNKTGITMHKFSTAELHKETYEKQKKLLIAGFKSYIDKEIELYHELRAQDPEKTERLPIGLWAQIISDYIYKREGIRLEPAHIITVRDYLCPCNDATSTAQYTAMFSKLFRNKENRQIFEFLAVLFNLIDTDRNGSISAREAKQAIELLNSKLGTKYTTDFIQSMDTNGDHVIDIREFQSGFSKAFNL